MGAELGAAGPRLARGAGRALWGYGFIALPEFALPNGLRADLFALGPQNEIWLVECKSSRADFLSDRKWDGYLPYCDRFFWAVSADFPDEILPPGMGLMRVDAFGGEIIQQGPLVKLAAARRQALIRDFARAAAQRLAAVRDPEAFGLLGGGL